MKKLILCFTYAVFLCSSLVIKAQNFALGVRGGISIPNLTAGGNQNPLNTGYSSRQGADVAIFAEFKISDHFSVQPMIEYSSQGGKKNGFQALTVPDQVAAMFPPGQVPTYLYANYNSEAKLDYLLVPILAKFGWNFHKESPFRIYADVGPFFGYLISAKQVTSGNDNLYTDPAGTQPLPIGPQSFDATDNIRSQLHKANVGVEGNIGLSYRFGLSNIFVEGGGNYGFLNIQKGTQNGKNNTGAATASIGYSYWFK
ncbi:MAG: porin family protein [Candidatus Pedobacter colombiensis]|uniref:Porin family protein n=1 Tax=Candidatus Pedobacter colombiensis TaxID=3121371 RepID=A0AAJ6B952_9SPHI|nr:porin family protein [Pedobacter sp.]WEK21574.1 MAG: porin family protein [Pedobacter sp.]